MSSHRYMAWTIESDGQLVVLPNDIPSSYLDSASKLGNVLRYELIEETFVPAHRIFTAVSRAPAPDGSGERE